MLMMESESDVSESSNSPEIKAKCSMIEHCLRYCRAGIHKFYDAGEDSM